MTSALQDSARAKLHLYSSQLVLDLSVVTHQLVLISLERLISSQAIMEV